MPLFLFSIAVPLFALFVWVAITVLRICLPEEPVDDRAGPFARKGGKGKQVPDTVGIAEITAHRQRTLHATSEPDVEYAPGDVESVPARWISEIETRRN